MVRFTFWAILITATFPLFVGCAKPNARMADVERMDSMHSESTSRSKSEVLLRNNALEWHMLISAMRVSKAFLVFSPEIEDICAETLELSSRLRKTDETEIPEGFAERARACTEGSRSVREYLAHSMYGSPEGIGVSRVEAPAPSPPSGVQTDATGTSASTPALRSRNADRGDSAAKTLPVETPKQSRLPLSP